MNNLLMEGVNLMLTGMGAVFVFLTLLVYTTTLMSKLVAKWAPEPVRPVPVPPPSTSPTLEEQQLLAVISAAIHEHRSRQKQ